MSLSGNPPINTLQSWIKTEPLRRVDDFLGERSPLCISEYERDMGYWHAVLHLTHPLEHYLPQRNRFIQHLRELYYLYRGNQDLKDLLSEFDPVISRLENQEL